MCAAIIKTLLSKAKSVPDTTPHKPQKATPHTIKKIVIKPKKLNIEHGVILEVKRRERQIRREYLSLTNPSILK